MEKTPDWRSENYAKAFETYDRADEVKVLIDKEKEIVEV